MQIVAVSGSLRFASTNTQLLYAAQGIAPDGIQIAVFTGIGDLPHFNPDRENEHLPTVNAWRGAVRGADTLLFSTPEYAHGLPGSLKNALDWLVGSGELESKPFALLNATGRGTFAQASLIEVLSTMAARHIAGVDVTLSLSRNAQEETLALTVEQAQTVRAALETLRHAYEENL